MNKFINIIIHLLELLVIKFHFHNLAQRVTCLLHILWTQFYKNSKGMKCNQNFTTNIYRTFTRLRSDLKNYASSRKLNFAYISAHCSMVFAIQTTSRIIFIKNFQTKLITCWNLSGSLVKFATSFISQNHFQIW